MYMNERTVPELLTIVAFDAYDKKNELHFFDATPEQCCEYIWKKICHTAVIRTITEYPVVNPKCIYGFKKKLTDDELQKLYKR